MKPNIVCENFDVPEDLTLFMKDALGEILRIIPYESHMEAHIRKELEDYLMTISINYSEGKFIAKATDSDLKRVITQSTADIFTQVRTWWKFRFGQDETNQTDWAGDLTTSTGNPGKPPLQNEIPAENLKKPLRVLIVDDDIESVTPLELCLAKLGCTTFVVNNGFEAIHEIVSGDRIYDVVILDWNMPEMTGGQALINAQKVIFHAPSANSHWENKKLPVITYSSRARGEIHLPECEDFRHIDHWEKPASYLNLLSKATETLSRL